MITPVSQEEALSTITTLMQYFTAFYKAASRIQAEAAPGMGSAEISPSITSSHLPLCHIPSPAHRSGATACSLTQSSSRQCPSWLQGSKHPLRKNNQTSQSMKGILPASFFFFFLLVTTSALYPHAFSWASCYRLLTLAPEDRDYMTDLRAAVVHSGATCRQAVKKLTPKKIIKSFNVLQ